jgi:hypothetical protein
MTEHDETLTQPIDPAEHLSTVAAGYGIVLEPDRLEVLVAKAKRAYGMTETGEKAAFKQDGLLIGAPTEQVGTDETISELHFIPKTTRMPRGATLTQRGEALSLVRRGLTSIQDYALLVTAGYIPQPTRFLGHTNNREMATMAVRFGFLGQPDGTVEATFDAVRQRVLSPESVKLQRALVQRVKSVAGGVALRAQ